MSGNIIGPSGLVLVPAADPSIRQTGAFAGMDTAALQAALISAQGALLQLISTGQPTVVSYGSGDGQKSVTYSRTNEFALRNLIRELQQNLGLGCGRRALGVVF